jgi:hypothetical protein
MAQKLAVVEFQRCICTKMGTPNDEVFHGHPLHGKGFAGYLALAVENSNWLKELEAINAVHSNYKSEPWRELKHYILPFHDSTFECVARSFIVETYQTNLPQLLTDFSQRGFLFGPPPKVCLDKAWKLLNKRDPGRSAFLHRRDSTVWIRPRFFLFPIDPIAGKNPARVPVESSAISSIFLRSQIANA